MSEETSTIREIRINPIVPSESVLVATARSMRPRKEEDLAPRDTRERVEKCPFCKGNEHKTPPTIASYPSDEQWEMRVVENLFPVLGSDSAGSTLVFGLQQAIDGYGKHEVVIDHSRHGIAIHEMSQEHLVNLFQLYQHRLKALYASSERIKYVLVFKNFGPAAGASIAHTHSQIIAMPVVPENLIREVEHSSKYYQKNRHCIFCSLIDEALTFETTIYDRVSGEVKRKINVRQYIIDQGERFIAIKPFASRYEWELHIMPLQHQSDFLDATKEDFEDFAAVLHRSMARLDKVIGGAQYNFFLHSIPKGNGYEDCHASYHWHLEICPRTSIPTGFELGSGLFVNTISPEDAAEQLRKVEL